MKIYAVDPRKNKKVLCGEVVGEMFIREVKPEHYMEKVKGYGMQETTFEKLVVMGVKKVRFIVKATGKILSSDLSTWLDNGRVADFGNGRQRFLSLKYMKGGE